MSISDKLAGLNAARFAEWTKIHNENNSRPALFAFKGDVYTGLDADSLAEDDVILRNPIYVCFLVFMGF